MVSVRQTTMKKKSTGKSTTKETKRNLEFKRKKNKESSEEEKNNSQTLAPISTQGKYIPKFGKAPKRLNDKDKKSGSTETKKLKIIAEGNEQEDEDSGKDADRNASTEIVTSGEDITKDGKGNKYTVKEEADPTESHIGRPNSVDFTVHVNQSVSADICKSTTEEDETDLQDDHINLHKRELLKLHSDHHIRNDLRNGEERTEKAGIDCNLDGNGSSKNVEVKGTGSGNAVLVNEMVMKDTGNDKDESQSTTSGNEESDKENPMDCQDNISREPSTGTENATIVHNVFRNGLSLSQEKTAPDDKESVIPTSEPLELSMDMGNSTKLETKDEIGRTADDNRKMDSTDQSLLNEAHDTNTVDVSSDTIPSTPPNNNSELETTINESKEIPLCSKDVCHISAIEITSQGNGGERKEMTEVMQADAENNKPDDLKNCVTDVTDSQFFMFDNDMDDSLDSLSIIDWLTEGKSKA